MNDTTGEILSRIILTSVGPMKTGLIENIIRKNYFAVNSTF